MRMKNSKGDDLTALILTVSTKEDADEEEYRGRKVTGAGWVDSDEDSTKGDKKSPPPSGSNSRPPIGSGTGSSKTSP